MVLACRNTDTVPAATVRHQLPVFCPFRASDGISPRHEAAVLREPGRFAGRCGRRSSCTPSRRSPRVARAVGRGTSRVRRPSTCSDNRRRISLAEEVAVSIEVALRRPQFRNTSAAGNTATPQAADSDLRLRRRVTPPRTLPPEVLELIRSPRRRHWGGPRAPVPPARGNAATDLNVRPAGVNANVWRFTALRLNQTVVYVPDRLAA